MYICAGSGYLNVEDDLGEVFTVACPGCNACVENPDQDEEEDDDDGGREYRALYKEEANEPEYVPFGELTDSMFH